MKITVLGSSHGVPSAERYCSCTMIEVEEKIYLIDAGAPVVDLLLRNGKRLEDLRTVFTTHSHSDHINGLIGLTDLCGWYFKNAAFDVFVTGARIAPAISAYIKSTGGAGIADDRIRYRVASEGEVYNDGNVRVAYIPTKHCLPWESYAVLFESEGKRLLFTGDLSINLREDDFPKVAEEISTELIMCEMAHFKYEHLEKYMGRLKTKHLCFNHVYPIGKLDTIKAISDKGMYSYKITAAADGDVINI